ncbi:MAG: lipid A phosphoethanolamine transferase [Clostridium sp.]|nr:lipid A phosphoethanolamine transferase [Clostridium sp.]
MKSTLKKITKWEGWDKVLLLLWVAALAVPNTVLSITEPMSVWGKLANVLLPLGVYGLIMVLVAKKRWTAILLVPIVFFAAFQLVLLYLYGNSIIAVDMLLNLVTTNASEAGELLASILPSVVIVVVLYVPLIIWGIWALCKHKPLPSAFLRHQVRNWAGVAGIGLAATICAYASEPGYSIFDDMYPVNIGKNICLAVDRTEKTAARAQAVKDFTFFAESAREPSLREAHIMVIGETARAANFSLYGYGRPTNPQLENEAGLVVFTKALSQSNTTHKSVPMLLTSADADNFEGVYRQKGLLTALKEAGYHTVFLSNQKFNRSLIDELAFEADECIFINESDTASRHHLDLDLLPLIGKALGSDHDKVFIVCHTYGSHFDYYDRYSRDEAFFTPDGPATATAGQRDILINEYDNTIRQTDALLHAIIDSLREHRPASSMLYTSDHGEDIFDDDRQRFLHASPTPTFNQLHVPFLVWTSDSLASIEPLMRASLLNNKDKDIETSASAFFTMLSLAGVQTPHAQKGLSAAEGDLAAPKRKYLNDHNEAVPLLEALPDTADRLLISKYKIN